MNSTAFRRLQQKTQVFAPSHHDHFRTRLTHTLEVAEIARCLAAGLTANAELAEAIALAHDLGHPPFGHAGEDALDEAMQGHGGFNHNTHAVRVLEYLEHPFPGFRGLNLTRETLDGLRCHETRFDEPARGEHVPSIEAQIASLADRIAYDCHDLEDAIGAGLINRNDVGDIALWRDAAGEATTGNIHAVRRGVLDAMVDAILTDVLTASADRLAAVASRREVSRPDVPIVAPSDGMESKLAGLEDLLRVHVYQHAAIRDADAEGRRMILDLFAAYQNDPGALPDRFRQRIDEQGPYRVICDYIAGMTDRFCQAVHDRTVSM